MTIYYRYFRVASGPLMEKALEIEAANAEARKAVAAFRRDVGAESALSHSNGQWAGFTFSTTPDQTVWKQPNSFGAYMPRKNTAAGREIMARIEALPLIVHVQNALDAVGLHSGLPVLMRDRHGHWPTLTGIPRLGVLFLTVPWRDIDPAKLAEYKRKREAGTELSMEMDHLCWEPSAGMQEVKRWEVEKEIEELNRKIEARSQMAAAIEKAAQP